MRLTKSGLGVLAATFVAMGLLSGCSGTEQPAETPETTEASEQLSGTLRIWGNPEVLEAMAATVEQFELDTSVDILLEPKSYPQIDAGAIAEIGSESGPDILIGPHTWTGSLVQSGLIAPIDQFNIGADFTDASVNAFRYQGNQYGFGFVTENVALVCNKDAVSSQPQSLSELIDAGVSIALSQVTPDPYHLYFAQSSFGAPLFETDQTGSYLETLGLGTQAGFDFAAWFSANSKDFVFADYDQVANKMANGDLDCWITGPWSAEGLESSNQDFEAFRLPAASEYEARPLMSAQGFFLTSKASGSESAKKFLTEYLASELVQRDIYQQLGGLPAHKKVRSLIKDPLFAGFAQAGIDADPVPSNPQMQFVWYPWGKALTRIAMGEDSKAAWEELIEEIRSVTGITE